MAHIDYYMFPLSPFTYLAGQGLEEVAQRHGATITYKPFALLKVFELTGGLPPAQRHPSRQAYRLQELARISARTGLSLNLKPAHWPTNPVPASSAIIGAQAAGGGDVGALCFSILRACWAEEKDIAEDAVLKACLEDAGFDPALLDTTLLSGAETFERNTQEALEANVFGAPTYVVGDEVFFGQDRLSYLDDYLASL
ncbi:MAG: 2-hydroxychromene-2-carboxylate isomerase [Pseudomonadota bacterium]